MIPVELQVICESHKIAMLLSAQMVAGVCVCVCVCVCVGAGGGKQREDRVA